MTDSAGHSDPDVYVRERVAAPGSTLYYCTLFAPAAQARRSITLEAFRRELDDVIDDCREPAVAAARVGWWHDEVQRVVAGGMQHPVTRLLAEVLPDPASGMAGLSAAIAATAAATTRQSWADDDALQRYCLATGGQIAALDCGAEDDDERVRAIGALLCAHDMLAGLWRRPRRGCQVFPAAQLAAAGVSPADLFATPAPAAADRLVRVCATAIRTDLAGRLEGWRPLSPAAGVLSARARIAAATLTAISRGGTDWLSRHTAISPLRKLWIGWRVSRRFRAASTEPHGPRP